MRFETLETRTVFDQSLGAAIEFEIDTSVELQPVEEVELPTLPSDIQFRTTADDFRYESANLDPDMLDELVGATEEWANDPRPLRTFKLTDTAAWRKSINTNPVSIHEDGYVIAERVETQGDTHTLLTIQKLDSECYMHGGLFMKPDYHYRYSFDVRHPESERTWLENADGNWSIVSQLWGPREDGETLLEPPFSIYTLVQDGVPYWIIRSIGDSNRITTPGGVESYETERVPMTNIGEWHHFDIEFVPNAYGDGLVRTWLNGELVAEWTDVQSAYSANYFGQWTGPLNPAFGVYSYSVADGQEAHLDNMVLQCNGEFQSSISGRITGSDTLGGTAVYATNNATGERYGTHTEKNGVYVLAVPKGEYTVTALNEATGQEGTVEEVSTLNASTQLADIHVTDPAPPTPKTIVQEELTLAGDLNGDGVSDVINRLADGSWQVLIVNSPNSTVVDSNDLTTRGRRDRSQDLAPTDDAVESDPLPSAEPESAPLVDPASTSVWTSWTNTVNWTDIHVADFNGDGMDDIAGRATDFGGWWVAESTGTGFINRYWGKWTTGIDWINVNVGDFNGDGLADIAGRAATNGEWWISVSNGESFNNSSWGRWTNKIDWEVVVGDFNGDGMDDIAGRAATDGTWWVGQSNGTRFQNSYWGRFTTNVQWSSFVVGDFNGDGMSDLVGRAESDGTFWVAESTGSRCLNQYWGRWSDTVDWLDVTIADVNGDGTSDLVGRADSDGSWWIAKSNGEKFQNQYWGAVWSQDVDWLTAVIDDFDGDGTADLLGVNSENWWLSV